MVPVVPGRTSSLMNVWGTLLTMLASIPVQLMNECQLFGSSLVAEPAVAVWKFSNPEFFI